MSDRFRDALKNAWKKIEEQEWIVGTLGRINSDATFTFVVPGRPTFVYVTIRTATGAQTVVPARNDAGVPHTPRLAVRMKLEHGNYVIYSRTARSDLSTPQPQNPYGIESHSTSHKHGGSDEVATATPAANAIPKADAGGLLNDWVQLSFLNLTDVPADYVAQAGNSIRVNATEDGLEFFTPSAIAKYAADFTVASSVAITHNLNTVDVIVQVRSTTGTDEIVYPDIQITDANNVALLYTINIGQTHRVVVIG